MLWESQACRLLEGTILCVSCLVPEAKNSVWHTCSVAFCWAELAIWCWEKNVVSGVRLTLAGSLALPLGVARGTLLPFPELPCVRCCLTNWESRHEALHVEPGEYWCLVSDCSRGNSHPSHPFSARAFYFSKCSWFKRKHFQRKPSWFLWGVSRSRVPGQRSELLPVFISFTDPESTSHVHTGSIPT